MFADDSKTLKHVRVYNWLKGMISRNRFKVGEKLPTETEIANMFSVNRMTVRQAMDMLVQENCVTRVRGKGTFLVDRNEKVTYLLDNIISFETIAHDHNLKSSYKMIDRQVVKVSPQVAEELMVPLNSMVIYVVRLVSGNDVPMYIERSFYPFPEFNFVLDMDLNQPKLYPTFMEKSGGIALNHALQILVAGLLDVEEKTLLEYPEDSPVACIRQKNIIYDSNGVPVLVFDATFPGDKFQFKVHSGNYSTTLITS